MIQFPEEFDSVFRYVEVVSQRAQQIIGGAKLRTESRASKPTLQARDDVDGGTVEWRVLTQEELDAQRQAMVEQFKAEMAVDEKAPVPDKVRDVLPTAAVPPVAADEDDRDDELVRLQHLLGLMGGKPTASGEADAADEDDGNDDGDAVSDDEPLDLDEGGDEEVDEED